MIPTQNVYTSNSPKNINPHGNIKSNKNVHEESNPLSSFFRKSKLSITLPSKGKWYPEGILVLNDSGELDIYAMTASDDIKFRTGDATLSGQNIYDVIKSCAPGILKPEVIPHIDIDTILLAIRTASYGGEFDFTVSVPNTTMTKVIRLNSHQLLSSVAKRAESWDEEIIIEDETGQKLFLIVTPIPISNLFHTSKTIYQHRMALNSSLDAGEGIKDEAAFISSLNNLSKSSIDLLCSSIKQLKIIDKNGNELISLSDSNPQDSVKIISTINEIDIAYFNAIRNHIDEQRKKYTFYSPKQISTQEELLAGATKEWTAELTFMGSNFLPNSNII